MNTLLYAIEQAGYHEDKDEATRLFDSSKVTFEEYFAAVERGRQRRLNGEKCKCPKCLPRLIGEYVNIAVDEEDATVYATNIEGVSDSALIIRMRAAAVVAFEGVKLVFEDEQYYLAGGQQVCAIQFSIAEK